MKGKRILAVLLVAAAAAGAVVGGLALAGFFKLTPMKLTRKSIKELAKIQSFDSDVRMEYEGTIQFMGSDADFSLNADCDFQGVTKTGTSHVNGRLGTELPFLGELSVPVESYQQYQDGSMLTYTRFNNSDWLKSKTEPPSIQTPSEGGQLGTETRIILGIMQKIASGEIVADLSEETEILWGQEVYRINITITGDLLNQIVHAVTGAQGENSVVPEDFDISDSDAAMVLYIYRESRLPARLVIDCTALGRAVIRNLFKNSDAGETVSTGTNRFVITADITEYNTIDEITVPKEVVSTAVESDQFDLLSIFMGK